MKDLSEESIKTLNELNRIFSYNLYAWENYAQIFDTEKTRVDFIGKRMPDFFVLFEKALLVYIILEITKLLEQHNKRSLTLLYLLSLLEKDGIVIDPKMKIRISTLKKSANNLFIRRNKKIAHLDVSIILANDNYLFTRREIKNSLFELEILFKEINSLCCTENYNCRQKIIYNEDCGLAVLRCIAKSMVYDDLVWESQIKLNDWRKHLDIKE